MRSKTSDYLTILKIDTEPRLHVFEETLNLAEGRELTELLSVIEAAIDHDRETLELEARWSGRKAWTVQHGPEAQELDRRVDAVLSGVSAHLDNQARIYGADHPRAAQAEALRLALFPSGLAYVTQGSFVAESQRVGALMRAAREPERAAAIAELGLADAFARLAELTKAFQTTIMAAEPLSFERLREAREIGEENLAAVIVLILARFSGRDQASREARSELLAPVEAQDRLRSEAFRRRGADRPSSTPAAEGAEDTEAA